MILTLRTDSTASWAGKQRIWGMTLPGVWYCSSCSTQSSRYNYLSHETATTAETQEKTPTINGQFFFLSKGLKLTQLLFQRKIIYPLKLHWQAGQNCNHSAFLHGAFLPKYGGPQINISLFPSMFTPDSTRNEHQFSSAAQNLFRASLLELNQHCLPWGAQFCLYSAARLCSSLQLPT